jgi:hypothetical protein
MRRSGVLALAVAVSLAATVTQAEAQLAGKWSVELGEWQAEGGGEVQIQSSNSGQLEVTVKGDSAVAVWTGTQSSGPPLTLRGKITGNKMVVQGNREGRVNMNGAESTISLVIEFELTAADGLLSGTMRLKSEGAPALWRTAKGKPAG